MAVYAMALNLSAKDPFTYVLHSLRDKGCLDRAAHLIRRFSPLQTSKLRPRAQMNPSNVQ